MQSEHPSGRLLLDVLGSTARVVIDNPRKRNAMSPAMWAELPAVLEQAAADPAVRALVLTGAGETFCAGADVAQLALIRENGAEDRLVHAAEAALINFPKPTIAVVDGFCVGGGCQLAVACDLRFATSRARFGITPAKLGIVYPATSLRRLTELVGPASAKLLLFSADLIDARHALRIGLVDEAHEAGGLDARVAEFTQTLASRSQLTQSAAKDVIDAAARGEPLDERAKLWTETARAASEDEEGIAAFLDRRAPRFTWTPGDNQ